MKKQIFNLLMLILPCITFAQIEESTEREKKNYFYVTGGSVLLSNVVNLSYEREFYRSTNQVVALNFRCALGARNYYELFGTDAAGIDVLAACNIAFGPKSSQGLVEIGGSYTSVYDEALPVWPLLGISFRTDFGTDLVMFQIGASTSEFAKVGVGFKF
ncbi:MAG: hypothetical protein MRY83_00285 [Flavobacteriales bacterium]|nr:hypothetical protein [Flavobacteriales bacterium]